MANVRFHITTENGRTTITMDRVLADLLALRLTHELDLSAVRAWCQEQVNRDPGAFGYGGTSQRLNSLATLEIAASHLRHAYEQNRSGAQG